MEMNLRKDGTFVQDTTWDEQYDVYESFIKDIEDKKVVLLELGVGYNTPSIIKYPFEHIASKNSSATLIRMNKEKDEVSLINKKKTIAFGECISQVLRDIKKIDMDSI